MHSNISWLRKYLAFSVHGIWKWGRCVPYSICDRVVHHWKANVLLGNVFGTIHKSKFGENLGNKSSISRCWSWTDSGIYMCYVRIHMPFPMHLYLKYHKLIVYFPFFTPMEYISTYYSSLVALTVYYFFASFSSQLPWSQCLPEWGPSCVDSISKNNSTFIASSNQSEVASSSEMFFL